MRLAVSIATQMLRLWDGHHLVKHWPCSTSKYGIGFVEGSNKTPLGLFTVAEKHGAGAASGTIFKARVPIGQWKPGQITHEDLVLTRILRLHGLEPRNENTFARYIYIHGTNNEQGMGKPGSHGCVRLRNDHMIEVFDLVPEGTLVCIDE
jgi:L,D-transpeptidase YbiS